VKVQNLDIATQQIDEYNKVQQMQRAMHGVGP